MYDILKKNVPAGEWPTFFEQLIAERIKSERWVSFHQIADIYSWEEQWENILNLLNKYPTLDNIAHVEKQLATRYAPQLIDLYFRGIQLFLKNNISRSHYQTACKYLRRMKKLGGQDKTEKLIAFLRFTYPQRRALMEELNRV